MVSFSMNQASVEGSRVSLRVILNGEAAVYPVSVPYVVTGSAAVDGSDHDLIDGVAVINQGLETSISFNTLSDGPGEGTEEIVIAMNGPTNAIEGPNATHIIQLLEGNVAPRISLSAEQGGVQIRNVVIGEGSVTVIPTLIDPNADDNHSYDWTATDARLRDIDSAVDTYTFTPEDLSPGIYTLRLRAGDGSTVGEASLTLNLITDYPSLSPAQDSDGDGTDDLGEGIADGDNDGVPDYLDAIPSSNVLQGQSALSTSYLIEAEPGVRLTLGSAALGALDGQASVSLNEIESDSCVSTGVGYDFSGGLFDFAIQEIPLAGQSVEVVIPQLAPIPLNPVYRKLASGSWRDFVVDSANSLASAPGEPGYCPPPGDSSYTPGLTTGHWCVQLIIEDGGPNDADGSVNRAIEDPGGVAQRLSTPVSVTSSGGGGAGSGMLFLLVLIALGQRQLRATQQGKGSKLRLPGR
jgi:hypothetical protein